MKASRPQSANQGKPARIVADGLGYTNEAVLDARGEWLYVNETFARRTTRFRIGADASLAAPETVNGLAAMGLEAKASSPACPSSVWRS